MFKKTSMSFFALFFGLSLSSLAADTSVNLEKRLSGLEQQLKTTTGKVDFLLSQPRPSGSTMLCTSLCEDGTFYGSWDKSREESKKKMEAWVGKNCPADTANYSCEMLSR
jgi:hypothetical protein